MSVIDIAIGVLVDALISLIIAECASKRVPVEQGEVSFHFGIGFPSALEYCALAEVVGALSFLPPLFKVPLVDVLVGVLQRAWAMRKVIEEAASIGAAIFISNCALSVLVVVLELALVGVALNLVEKAPLSLFLTVFPFPVIVFLLTAKFSQTVLMVVPPASFIVCCALLVIINAVSVLEPSSEGALIDFSAAEDVGAFPMKVVFLPFSEIDIADGIIKDALAFAKFVGSELANIFAVTEGELFSIWKRFEEGDEVLLLDLIVLE